MKLTNPHSCGGPVLLWVRKSQRRDGECGGCLGTRWVFLFDAKWEFSFETSRVLNCPVTDIALTKWGILITKDIYACTQLPHSHNGPNLFARKLIQ